MAATEKKRRNVLAIIEMFAKLGLPVCDDEESIKEKRDEQRGARNRELNSTKGSVAAKAQQWFDNVNALLNRRDELLAIVYDEFARLGEAILTASVENGRETLGPDTRIALRDIAMTWCRARADLAQLWIRRFVDERGLEDGGPLDRPELVFDFKARRRGSKVHLSWSRPNEHCDSVVVMRESVPEDGAGEALVCEGEEDRFVDHDVLAGVDYVYRAYTVYEGRRSLTSTEARTVKSKGGARANLRVPLLAALVLSLVTAGVLGWDHITGLGPLVLTPAVLHPNADAPVAEAAETSEAPAEDDTSSATPLDRATSGLAALLFDSDDDEGEEDPAPRRAEPEPDPVAPATPRPAGAWAAIADPPKLAFAGHSLRLELDTDRPVSDIVDTDLVGVTILRKDLDEDPPSVRLDVNPLPEDVYQGEARWSFRLRDRTGALSDPVEGTCLVIPGAD